MPSRTWEVSFITCECERCVDRIRLGRGSFTQRVSWATTIWNGEKRTRCPRPNVANEIYIFTNVQNRNKICKG